MTNSEKHIQLNIVSPVSRPENLIYLYASIDNQRKKAPQNIKIAWHVFLDIKEENYDPLVNTLKSKFSNTTFYWHHTWGQGVVGHNQRNFYLSSFLQDDWVYFLDDDNILHPDFIETLIPILNQEDVSAIIVSQQVLKDHTVRHALPENITPGKIDTAQFIIKTSYITPEDRFPLQYDGDGHFITNFYKKNKNVAFLNDSPASLYNALNPLSDVTTLQHPAELAEFVSFYQSLNAKGFIEIGSFAGGTLQYLLQTPTLKKSVSIDLEIPQTDHRYKDVQTHKAKWDSWVQPTNKLLKLNADSTNLETIKQVKDFLHMNKVDLLFIDGDHSTSSVIQDFENYKQFVSKNGYIAFHDSIGISEVSAAINILKEKHNLTTHKVIYYPDAGWGITIVKL
jgi:hypothetical protein